ncbi:MAG: hypothetical protein A3A94_00550 [Candidatus Portnoybacteria bacterium RIFCSPLOWO2_01_FULL_43_11]|uniref:Uncharacterized protein n=3 Tax=Candidatus Portnoyibacteriota TaxID=1817913 RepID=A0A1G2FAP0_9BACT|nr:MAG: hypothetical protein A2815_02140 [Candidatus Portnoybacteria bacterium RIFCSPHIGHO2_01_FULL_40_12b]OGZ36979.1 MAG: hypothetical protein A3D38_00670 [Candidatus Portnoybacteria bacterium RIFCSPHIGHO2_02_FULL_40_23]OGZ38336.1 MAG: hypothetical protein A3A94_00550 [Candidatus Portnoybacteria bacterium RIFCSPLOWO2_01_FULL_43_11]OGZ41190.1 MAG: hypothetical protein A3I20_02595 [Candidatus Portnoybacteria bacterium RIFCSPLOWO2_02_FULL_40_15]
MNLINSNLGSKNLLCAHGRVGQTQLSFWRRISQSEIRNPVAESEGGQKFLPPSQPPSLLPARVSDFVSAAPAARQLGISFKKGSHCVQ